MYLIRGRNIAWLLECTSSRMNLARVPTSREVTGLSRSLWSCWMLGRWNSIRHHYSLNGWTSCRKISWRLKAATFRFKLFQSLGKLTGTSAAALPICLSNYVIFTSSISNKITQMTDVLTLHVTSREISWYLIFADENRLPRPTIFSITEYMTFLPHRSYWNISVLLTLCAGNLPVWIPQKMTNDAEL